MAQREIKVGLSKVMRPLMWRVTGGVEPVYISSECLHAQTMDDQDRTMLVQEGETMCDRCGEYSGGWRKVWVEQ